MTGVVCVCACVSVHLFLLPLLFLLPFPSFSPLLPSPLLSHVVQLGPDGGKYLSGVILNNKVLEHLMINNCELKDEGAIPIADGESGMWMYAVIDLPGLSTCPLLNSSSVKHFVFTR